MAVSARTRFEIFKRDYFACRYCGATAADGARLEVDHVTPRSRGGTDGDDNLVTACFSCNRGKSDGEILEVPEASVDLTEYYIALEYLYMWKSFVGDFEWPKHKLSPHPTGCEAERLMSTLMDMNTSFRFGADLVRWMIDIGSRPGTFDDRLREFRANAAAYIAHCAFEHDEAAATPVGRWHETIDIVSARAAMVS